MSYTSLADFAIIISFTCWVVMIVANFLVSYTDAYFDIVKQTTTPR
jgi:hypothetical protein